MRVFVLGATGFIGGQIARAAHDTGAEKGWRTFGITPRPFAVTVRDTVGWFREHSYL